MRGVLVLLMALAIASARLSATTTCPGDGLTITVQIHDYEHVRPESLSRASEIVTQVYQKIDVQTEWFDVLRQWERRARPASGQEPRMSRIAQMTIMTDCNTQFGTTPEVFTERLDQWGADVIGLNCGVGPAIILTALERMRAVTKKVITVARAAGT